MKKNYRKTLLACSIGSATQAITANFVPLLFLTFHTEYQISLGKIALIPTVFFLTQLIVDALCAQFGDKAGYRAAAVASQVASAAGLSGLALLPEILPDPFAGVLLCVVIYAGGSGLMEALSSPMIEACPFDHKETVMSLLHSFYCWGTVGVVLLSTLFFAAFGIENWRILACAWAIVPLYNVLNFLSCPIVPLVKEGTGMTVSQLCKVPLFWLAVMLMACSGASELAMAQWASAYAESALGLGKTVGDLAGPCLFAFTMGVSRILYSKYGEKVELTGYMLASGALCLVCYFLASIIPNPAWGLVGCIACGFSVGIMWPGTLSIASARLPLGGTALFALLAMAGDLGGAFGPSLVGYATQQAGDNLGVGLGLGCIFPIGLMIGLILIRRVCRRSRA